MLENLVEDITRFVFLADEPAPADILFLPGGSHPEQGEHAAVLYHQGFAPWVLPAGGVSVKREKFDGVKARADRYDGEYETDWAFLADVLRKNGVPDSVILREDRSGYTKENALLSRRVTDEAGLTIRRAILCCKCFHARRALLCYQLAYPETEILVCPVPYYDYEHGVEISAANWHHSEAGIRRVLGELARCGNQFTEEILSFLNAAPTQG